MKMNTDLDYNAVVVEHFNQPHNLAEGPCFESTCGEGGNADTGVWIEFQLHMSGSRIREAKFRAYGCPHTIALASWLTDRLVGEKLEQDFALDKQEVVSVLALPTEKMRSVLVAEDALRVCASKISNPEVQI